MMSTHKHIWPILLLLAAVPLGVAGQNAAAAVAGISCIIQLLRRPSALTEVPGNGLWRRWRGWCANPIGLSTLIAVGIVLWIAIAGIYNPSHSRNSAVTFPSGYLLWIFLPPLVAAVYSPLSLKARSQLELALASIAMLMGLVAVSQYLWGWKLDDGHFVSAPTRAQGFYSHPLTFAYVSLLFLPYATASWVRNPLSGRAWALFGGSVLAVLASQSRTVQLIALVVIALNILMRARHRYVLASLAFAGVLVIAMTDNPIQKKIAATLSGGYDVRSGYPDDRLAFWHAHWEMFKERPIVGHGDDLNAAYRAPYYARIGLANFERQYEAHNMFLQVLINGGLVALAMFLAWWGVWLKAAWRWAPLAFETLLVLIFAGMTQNAFQDAEVRYVLTLVVAALALAIPLPTPPAKS